MHLWLLAALLGCPRSGYQGLEPDLNLPDASRSPAASADSRGWVLRAQVAAARGDTDEAEHSWLWALRLERRSPWVHLGYARWLAGQRRDDDARVAVSDALRLDPRNAEAHLLLGQLQARAGEHAEAIVSLERAVDLDGPDEALELLGHLDPDSAERTWKRWWDRGILSSDRSLARGRLGLRTHHPREAVDDLLRAVSRSDALPHTGQELLQAAREGCRVERAWEWARSDARVRGEADERWRQVGLDVAMAASDLELVHELVLPGEHVRWRIDALRRAGRHADALALTEGATDPAVVLRRGDLLAELGRPAEALEAWAALDASLATERRVLALLDLGRVADAEAAAVDPWTHALVELARGGTGEDLVADDPLLLARIRERRGDLEGAIEALSSAPVEARTLTAIARLHERLGDPDAAAEAWAAVAAVDPSAEAWLEVARHTLVPYGPPADDALTRALAADPCHVDALRLQAARSPDPTQAATILQRAVEAEPLNLPLLRELANALEACGDHHASAHIAARILRLEAS